MVIRIDDLFAKTVALDSSPLIYYIERHSPFFEQVQPFFEALEDGLLVPLTSVVTLTEVLVYPMRHGLFSLFNAYWTFFKHYLPTIQINVEIAETAARLRADYGLHTPDALQLATAITQNADFFLTNDMRLKRVKQIEVLLLSDLPIYF